MNIPTVHLICNAHLDPVWQWRWEEGCAEALSTFATAAALLREHPTLIFNHNEAVLYAWTREYAPALFAQIQALVAAGRWCIAGGWHLQPDVNLPDTESLIRHIALGKRFFARHFNAAPEVAYNFDSFGHSSGLPQILVRSGYKMYVHMRPQAPDLELPSDLYRWRGVDGSEVLALRIVVGLYHTERDNIERRLEEGAALALRLNRDVPVFWGIGDHGGGPTREDLKIIDRVMASETRVRFVHSTPDRLYQALKSAGETAPLVTGDLQRVFTGCYTSLSRVKRGAVKSLGALTQTEALRACAARANFPPYPVETMDAAWRDHLFNDFHDILPGTCIEPAEQDALGLYSKADDIARRVRLGTAAQLNQGTPRPLYIPVTVLNANPACRSVPVEAECMLDLRPKWSGRWHLRLFDVEGRELACQQEQPESLLPFNGWRRKVAFLSDLPAIGAARYELRIFPGDAPSPELAAPATRPEPHPEHGLVDSLLTADGRECLSGPLLQALVVEDAGDAWGTDHGSYRNVLGAFEFVPGSITRLAAGPIRTVTESVHRFGQSRIVLQTLAYAAFPALEFRLRVFWQEERCRLKLSIPTRLRFDSVVCEIPGGASARPADGQEHVHRRWFLVEGELGGAPAALAVAHQGCHGFDAKEGEIRLSVLRSAAYCHEQGFKLGDRPSRKYMDQGVHELRFLVLAGTPGELRDTVTSCADWLNAPPSVYTHLPIGEGKPGVTELSALLAGLPRSIRLLACKPAQEGSDVVLRLQEVAGRQQAVSLRDSGAGADLLFQPFEIKTLLWDGSNRLQEAGMISERPVGS